MTLIAVFRVKNPTTLKYLTTTSYIYYFWDGVAFSKRGRVYTGLQYISSSLEGRKLSILALLSPELSQMIKEYLKLPYQERYDKNLILKRAKELEFPDTLVITDSADEEVVRLKEFMKW